MDGMNSSRRWCWRRSGARLPSLVTSLLGCAALASSVLGCSGDLDSAQPSGEFPNAAPGAPGAASGDGMLAPGATAPGAAGTTPGGAPVATAPDGTPLPDGMDPAAMPTTGMDPPPVGTDVPDAEETPPAPANPGTVIARRLNHAEYNNTVRDLLGTVLTPADAFLADDPGAGFDTVGAAASLSPAYVRDYEAAAQDLIDDLYADSTRLATIVTCDVEAEGAACAESVMTAFARRAFRRPVTAAEVQQLLTPFDTAQSLGATATEGLRLSLVATLLSPHFIFKLEIDPDPASTAPRRLNDHELATRLSYALWSTMPDDDLFAAADAGTLATDEGLSEQISRMFDDPRIEELAENFAAQWLDFRHLQDHEVDAMMFGAFDIELAQAMQQEAQAFFLEFLRGDYAINELLTAQFTFADDNLASHYGLTPPGGAMSMVDTSGGTAPRAGLLTLGAVLTATSYATRTSPVRRGQFVMDRLLCSEVPPPPPDVPGLEEEESEAAVNTDDMTLRERFELHRQDPACFTCHQLMDPIGFGLENYDAIGRYRTEEGGLEINSSGDFSGVEFSGAVDLAAILAEDPRFAECVTEKFLTFAVGRFLDQPDDGTWVAHLSGTVEDANGSLGMMVRTVLMSEAFRSRQAVPPTP